MENGIEYLALTLVAVASCALLLSRMNRPLETTLPYWSILLVFIIGYFVKFYWAALDINGFLEAGQISDAAYSSFAFAPTFKLTVIAFTCVCFSSWLSLGPSRYLREQNRLEGGRLAYKAFARFLIITAPVLMILTFIAAYMTGITIMGTAPVSLPFRLTGAIFYTRTAFIPALLLALVFIGNKGRSRFLSRAGIMLLVLHGISDILLRSSRGQLIVMMMTLGFLFLAGGLRIRRLEWTVIIGGVLLTIFLAPLITEYRNYRIITQNKSISEAVTWSVQEGFSGKASMINTFTNGLKFIILRITGVEMLLRYTSLGIKPLGLDAFSVLRSPRGMAGYITVDILGVPVEAYTSAAVSLPGWFYLVGGTSFMAIGMIIYVLLVGAIWNKIRRLNLRILPVAQALFLLWVYSIAVEGTLDSQVISFIAMAASIFICEWLIRYFEKRPRKTQFRFNNL
jgi:hypothetical protein